MPLVDLVRSLLFALLIAVGFIFAYFYAVRRAVLRPAAAQAHRRPWIAAVVRDEGPELMVEGYGFTPLGPVELYAEHPAGSRWIGSVKATIDGQFLFSWNRPPAESRLVRAVDTTTRYRGAIHSI
jgi:hypothetical protein